MARLIVTSSPRCSARAGIGTWHLLPADWSSTTTAIGLTRVSSRRRSGGSATATAVSFAARPSVSDRRPTSTASSSTVRECVGCRDSTLRVGLVGAGSMGALHARVVAASLDRAGVGRRSRPRRRGRRGVSGSEPSGGPSIDLGTVDAVVVAAPTQFHHDIALDSPRAKAYRCFSRSRWPTRLDRLSRDRRACAVQRCGPDVRASRALQPCGSHGSRHCSRSAACDDHAALALRANGSAQVSQATCSSTTSTWCCACSTRDPMGWHVRSASSSPRRMVGSEDVADATLRFGERPDRFAVGVSDRSDTRSARSWSPNSVG